MKKILWLIAALVLFVTPAFSQTVPLSNLTQATIVWDAVTPPTGTTGTMKYQVYTRNDLVSTGVKVGSEITATQLLISFTPYVTYYVGVEAVFYPTGVATPTRSPALAWSSNAADCAAGVTFGFLNSPTLNMIHNLKFM